MPVLLPMAHKLLDMDLMTQSAAAGSGCLLLMWEAEREPFWLVWLSCCPCQHDHLCQSMCAFLEVNPSDHAAVALAWI